MSAVTDMKSVFNTWASSFNGDLSKWDVSSVDNMYHMFDHASSFNSDISKWDVSRVTNMATMFSSASSFSSDISKWHVSGVTNMNKMFYKASSFAHTLCGAWLTSIASKEDTFDGSSGKICTAESATSKTKFLSLHSDSPATCLP